MKNNLTANMDRHIGLSLLMSALALTIFACSSGGDGEIDNGENSSTSNGGNFDNIENSSTSNSGNFSVNSQIYNEDGNTKFIGNGTLKIYLYNQIGESNDLLDFGNVENGIIKLDPKIPNAEYLRDVNKFNIENDEYDGDIPMAGCTFLPSDGKYYLNEHIYLFLSTGEELYVGAINYDGYYGEDIERERVMYGYFSKATKINCTNTITNTYSYSYKISIDAKAGWNEIYYHQNGSISCGDGPYGEGGGCSGNSTGEFSTDKSIIKQDIKWISHN